MTDKSRPIRFSNAFLGLALLFAAWLMPVQAGAQDLTSTLNYLIPKTGMDLTLDSSSFIDTANNSNINSLRTDVLNEWVYPNATVSDSAVSISGVGRIGDQNFSASQLTPYQQFLSSGELSLTPGDQVFQLNWTLKDSVNGTFNFSTLGYESAAGIAKFEPLVYSAPINDAYITVTNPGVMNDVDFSVSNAFTQTAFGGGNLNIVCDNNGNLTNATATIGQTGSTFLWEAMTTKEPPVTFKNASNQQCATAVFHFGFTSGFKSITVGADGFTLGFTGALGWSGATESAVTKCCPSGVQPVPEASSAASFGLMATIGLLCLGFSGLKRKNNRRA